MTLTRYPFTVNPDIPELPCKELVVRCDFARGLSPTDAEAWRLVMMHWVQDVQSADFPTVQTPKHGAPANLGNVDMYQSGPITMECELHSVMCTEDVIPTLLARLSKIPSITSVEIE